MIFTATAFLLIVSGLGIVGSCIQLTSKESTVSVGVSLTVMFINIIAIVAILFLVNQI